MQQRCIVHFYLSFTEIKMLPFPLIASEQDTQGNTHLYVLGMVLHKCTEWKAASTNGDDTRQNCFELRHFLLVCFIRLCGLSNIKNHWGALKFLLDAVFGNLVLTAVV